MDSHTMMNTNTSAYLFIGGNTSFRESFRDNTSFCKSTQSKSILCATPRFAINLDNLPATFVEQGVGVTADLPSVGVTADLPFIGPLASILLCDAQPKISGGRVRLQNDGTVNVISSGQPPDGSFPFTAANLIFSNAFQDALSEVESSEVSNLVNTIAANMFMTNSSVDWYGTQDIAPLDISSINKNMDDFMSSAAKAFLDGYQLGPTDVTFDVVSVPGLEEGQQLALTTSKELFIVTVVLDVIITALLFTLVRSAPTWKGYPFNLANVLRLLQEGHTKGR